MPERMYWVFANQCGCPFGVMNDQGFTEAQAFAEFYESGKAFMSAVRGGVTATRYAHGTYMDEVWPKMSSTYNCPHGGA